jgi:hypothetical protein
MQEGEPTFNALPSHYRKDSPHGITPPNPDADPDIIQHITKHRGQKTPFTSVSESPDAIKHFEGILYTTQPNQIVGDRHIFLNHADLINHLKSLNQSSDRGKRVLAVRAILLATRAKEALVQWEFSLDKVKRKDRIVWCQRYIQKYFQKV